MARQSQAPPGHASPAGAAGPSPGILVAMTQRARNQGPASAGSAGSGSSFPPATAAGAARASHYAAYTPSAPHTANTTQPATASNRPGSSMPLPDFRQNQNAARGNNDAEAGRGAAGAGGFQPSVISRMPAGARVAKSRNLPSFSAGVTSPVPRRTNTLARPERRPPAAPGAVGAAAVGRGGLMRDPHAAPPAARAGATSARTLLRPSNIGPDGKRRGFQPWSRAVDLMTCCCLPSCMRACGKKDPIIQQAWREKIALCMLIALTSALVAFFTFGMRLVLCPESVESPNHFFLSTKGDGDAKAWKDGVIINGYEYPFGETQSALKSRANVDLTSDYVSQDISRLFAIQDVDNACADVGYSRTECGVNAIFSGSPGLQTRDRSCVDTSVLDGLSRKKIVYSWENVYNNVKAPYVLSVYNGLVINTGYYYGTDKAWLDANHPEAAWTLYNSIGRDATRGFYATSDSKKVAQCLSNVYTVGYVDKDTVACFVQEIIQDVMLFVVFAVVLIRFCGALLFSWIISRTLAKNTHKSKVVGGAPVAPARAALGGGLARTLTQGRGLVNVRNEDLYSILLVTAYSEGRDGLRATLESLAMGDYDDARKLLFVVCDGLITGSGEAKPTPDIVLEMLTAAEDPRAQAAGRGNAAAAAAGKGMNGGFAGSSNDTLAGGRFELAEPKSYIAIADGARQHNMARVYAGYYITEDGKHRVPMVVVNKCGTPAEASLPKPGNRGKRDSQLLLMNFLSRVMFDDRMTALDYELFRQIHRITGVTPDRYETLLMVDADTEVKPYSLTAMNNAMNNDPAIMGLCGETRIKNKFASWVTAIQVFEYKVSHDNGKAFESVFGGVTCLPGCFSMYRIKSRKPDETGSGRRHWVPILVNPDIVDEYSENVVDTLHKKNLLLLGEDRFLTTLMLRNFPKRKMVYVPQARCHTVVPDKFSVLLSQRRRWINSTIHNLLELVLVRDLCGIFCFSMQSVILLDLIGTIVLPAALALTIYLVISIIMTAAVQILPLTMLVVVLGLPGLLIVLSGRDLNYVPWLFVYLLALPVWNFVLPLYAFWHFDDFSWGATRKVDGVSAADDTHESRPGREGFAFKEVELRKWSDWERDRRKSRAMVMGLHNQQQQQNANGMVGAYATNAYASHLSYGYDTNGEGSSTGGYSTASPAQAFTSLGGADAPMSSSSSTVSGASSSQPHLTHTGPSAVSPVGGAPATPGSPTAGNGLPGSRRMSSTVTSAGGSAVSGSAGGAAFYNFSGHPIQSSHRASLTLGQSRRISGVVMPSAPANVATPYGAYHAGGGGSPAGTPTGALPASNAYASDLAERSPTGSASSYTLN